MEESRISIAVVVLGDLDRSPRMLNHALSAAQNNINVTLIGYQGSSLPDSIIAFNKDKSAGRGRITVRPLSTTVVDVLRKLPRILYLVYAILRILIQTF